MRAKVAVVAVVAFGLLGAVVITASAADHAQVAGDTTVLTDTGNTVNDSVTPMDRGKGDKKGHGGEGNDTDQGGGGNPNCPADDGVLVIVCANVEDVVSDILTT